ncbi:cellulose-binding domain-containing protein [Peterkaempfera sp. SMS 1(5)a]|uniref:cellulose-binding domain-containing protein n=1 Tax=Peterkaempfera podocarpi TaxID=3232308 RepID=UPI0036717DD8
MTSTPSNHRVRSRARIRTAAAAGASVLLAVGAALLPLPNAEAAATVGCKVDYTVNQWSGGYTAQIKVTNLGAAVSSWKLTWTYGADEHITSAWNSTVTQSGKAVTATNVAWNGSLATGGSADFGVQGTWAIADPPPADFALNGTTCNGATTGPTPTTTPPTSPTTPPTSTPPTSTPPTTPPPTAPTTPPPSAGCGTAVVCSGFEDQTGTVPTGDWQVVTPDCQGSGTAAIDTSVAYSGTRSLRIDGHAGYCNHVFVGTTKDVSSIGPVLYARMRVRHTTALPSAHVTSITMADANDGGKDLRIGGQNNALQWNRQSDDATLPVQSPAGVAQSTPLPTGRWVCLRFQIDTTKQSMSTYLDDTEVPGLHLDGTPTQDIDNQWLSRTTAPRPTTFRLGWESYGSGDDTLWFDDVAVGSQPIGC